MLEAADKEKILGFDDNYIWLRNSFLSPVILDGVVYPSVENAYQASKFLIVERGPFVTCCPARARHLATKYGMYEPGQTEKRNKMKDTDRLSLMGRMLRQKFCPGTYNSTLLIATGSARLVNLNDYGDSFWGACEGVLSKNHLGNLLEEVRQELCKL